jgi:antitoxin VapB
MSKEITTVRVFKSGNSQAVRLPKPYRVSAKELEIFRRGNEIVLREKEKSLARAFDLLASLPDDFDLSRRDSLPQERKGL